MAIKSPAIRSNAWKRAARGQECTLQIHPYCTGGTDTTVFAHYPSETHGMGYKSDDFFGADACDGCHSVIDGRNRKAMDELGQEEIQRCMMRGLHRTLIRRIAQGLMTIKGAA